ncbi:MAG: GNAT family N-acetyltransferase [Candidatus Hydrogenedentes bacterium]|nr:GNAT family N-acetyltransferase [Candidatus Hydrogenedentota bacterium]
MVENRRHGPDIKLAPSQAGDEAALARLWCLAFADKYRHIFGNTAEVFLETWLTRDPRVHKGSTLIWVDSAPAGFIQIGTPNPSLTEDIRALWSALFRYFGPFGALRRLLRLWILERPAKPQPTELHVRMLAVDPHYRGRGLAGVLLRYAEAQGLKDHKTQLVLEVSSQNEVAIRLYEHYGFVKQPLQYSFLLRWAIGHGHYYRMVKRLNLSKAS